MKTFESLSEEDKEALLKFPAYISLLAANANGGFDKEERKSAIQFSHIKTYSCHPWLSPFYREADKVFIRNILELDKDLPKEKLVRELAIKAELVKLEKILTKLDKEYTDIMYYGMETFKDHVSKAHHNVLQDFIFPIPIKGITG